MARAMASLRSPSSAPTRRSTWPRIGAGVLDQSANPRSADATARRTSATPERGNRPMTSFQSAGFRFSKYSPVAGGTHSPAMKFLKASVMTEPGRLLLGVARSGERLERREHEPPDDQRLGEHV